MNSKPIYQVFFQRYFQLLKDPKSFFKQVTKENSHQKSLFFLIAITIVGTLINIILTTPLLIKGTASFANITWKAQLLTLLYYPLYSLLNVVLASVIIYLILLLFRTNNHRFTSDLNVVAYTQTIPVFYSVLGTVIVLVTELFTGQSANSALLAVLTYGFPSVSAALAISVILSLLITVVSWFHLLRTVMFGLTSHYDLSKFKAVAISIFAFIVSFILLTVGSGLIKV